MTQTKGSSKIIEIEIKLAAVIESNFNGLKLVSIETSLYHHYSEGINSNYGKIEVHTM